MSKGRCLCGSVTWELLAEPFYAFNCHCRMCQKVHGTAFGTYHFVKPDQFRWTSGTETVVGFRSSDVLTRASCDTCGSVVPYPSDDGSIWVAPGGCHDKARKSDCNIFVVDSSPWHRVTGDLPRHDAYPEESGIPSVPNALREKGPDGVVRGSCQCGAIDFEVTAPIEVARYCHCSRCRHARAAPFASNGVAPLDSIRFVKGDEHLKYYKLPEARYFTQAFCALCSSAMPFLDQARGIAIVPLGSLDDDPGIRPREHIFVADKANWHDITDDLPTYEQGPPA